VWTVASASSISIIRYATLMRHAVYWAYRRSLCATPSEWKWNYLSDRCQIRVMNKTATWAAVRHACMSLWQTDRQTDRQAVETNSLHGSKASRLSRTTIFKPPDGHGLGTQSCQYSLALHAAVRTKAVCRILRPIIIIIGLRSYQINRPYKRGASSLSVNSKWTVKQFALNIYISK